MRESYGYTWCFDELGQKPIVMGSTKKKGRRGKKIRRPKARKTPIVVIGKGMKREAQIQEDVVFFCCCCCFPTMRKTR